MHPVSSSGPVHRGSLVAVMAVALGLAAPGPAAAQTAKAAAEAVFEEGLAAFEAGRYEEACPKLSAAVELTRRESLGGLLLLAECHEKMGRVASAWAVFREVASKASRAAQPDREAAAREGEARVAQRLHQLSLRIAPDVAALEGLVVSRGGERVPKEAFGVGLPADPGPLAIRVEAVGRAPHARTFEVPTTAGSSEVVVTLADLPVAGEAQPSGPVAAPLPRPAPRAPVPTEEGRGRGWLYAGLATAGVGVALIGVSTAVILSAKSDYDEAAGACGAAGCTADQAAAVDDARATGDVATILFGAGAGLAALGAVAIVIDVASSDGGRDGGGAPAASLRVGAGHLDLRASF